LDQVARERGIGDEHWWISGRRGACKIRAADKTFTHRVEGHGKISVDVKAPRSTKVSASGGGIFKKTEVERTPQMQEAKGGPPAIGSVPISAPAASVGRMQGHPARGRPSPSASVAIDQPKGLFYARSATNARLAGG
jgi:hypothetical protein